MTVVPVTVLGGYLGAGKTTLLNHLLRTASEPIAVLVNDFGEINIDADLIGSHDGETMTLTNGCICCSVTDGLAVALASVLELDRRPTRMVIEASGVADPGAVAGYCHRPGFMLDAVVVVVDGETLERRLADRRVGALVADQLRAADLVVINKMDLVADYADAEAIVAVHNDTALVVGTEQARVAPELLFGSEASPSTAASSVASSSVAAPSVAGSGERASGPEFESWIWVDEQPIDRQRIEKLMDLVPEDVHRMKGIVRLAGDDTKAWVLQRAGRRWSLRPVATPAAEVNRSSLVAIGAPGAVAALKSALVASDLAEPG